MSLTGYRLADGRVDLLALCEQLRPRLDEVRDRQDAAQVAEAVCRLADAAAAGTDTRRDPSGALLGEALAAYRLEQALMAFTSTLQDPNRLELRFARDPGTRRVGMLVMAARTDSYCAVLDDAPNLEPFSYWDGSDRPAEVSGEAWADRAKFWDRCLPTGRYGDARLSWSLRLGVDDGLRDLLFGQAGVGLVIAHAPSNERRALDLATGAVLRAAGGDHDIVGMFMTVRSALADGHEPQVLTAAHAMVVPLTVDLLAGAVPLPDLGPQRAVLADAAGEAADRLVGR
jgi:hypothetical protein